MNRSVVWLLCALPFVSCASAPSPSPSPAPAQSGSASALVMKLFCHDAASAIAFSKMGVPDDETPVDVVMSKDSIYVLFQPARLLRLSRNGEQRTVEMKLGRVGEIWTAFDIDPTDGAVWVVTQALLLHRITPNWGQTTLKLQKVEGEGGFWDLEVAGDALYAAPFCAEHGVWRIDRSGNVLGTAFPVPKPEGAEDEPIDLSQPTSCQTVQLESDSEGKILAWNRPEEKVYSLGAGGTWSEGPTWLVSNLPAGGIVQGLNVGEQDERWFLTSSSARLFTWKRTPVFVVNPVMRNRGLGSDTVLLVPREGSVARSLVDDCHGARIIDAAGDATGYVALTDRGLIFGDFATAPDLP